MQDLWHGAPPLPHHTWSVKTSDPQRCPWVWSDPHSRHGVTIVWSWIRPTFPPKIPDLWSLHSWTEIHTACSMDPRVHGTGATCSTNWLGQPLCTTRLSLWPYYAACNACFSPSGICATCSIGPGLAEAAARSGMLGEGEQNHEPDSAPCHAYITSPMLVWWSDPGAALGFGCLTPLV